MPASTGVLWNDTDSIPGPQPLSMVLVSGPDAPVTFFDWDPNGSWSIGAPIGYTGFITFTYQATDGVNLSNVAYVTVTVEAQPPGTVDDGYTLDPAAPWSKFHWDGTISTVTSYNTGGSLSSGIAVPGPLWIQNITGTNSSPVIGSNGVLYVGGQGLWAFDAATGFPLWYDGSIGVVEGAPVIGLDGTVYVATQLGLLVAFDGESGAQKWTFTPSGANHSSPTIVDGRIIFGSNGIPDGGPSNGTVYALNPDGTRLWEVRVRGHVHSAAAVGINAIAPFSTKAVYVATIGGATTGYLYALELANGNVLWEQQAPYHVKSSPVVTAAPSSDVYFVTETGLFQARSAFTGALVWERNLGATTHSSPAYDSINELNGKVYAIFDMPEFASLSRSREHPRAPGVPGLWTTAYSVHKPDGDPRQLPRFTGSVSDLTEIRQIRSTMVTTMPRGLLHCLFL